MASKPPKFLDEHAETLKKMASPAQATSAEAAKAPIITSEAVLQGIKVLPSSEMGQYQSFLIGNDKPLSTTELKPAAQDTPFALIGTSIFRCIDIACRLSTNPTITPKVIVVDNSAQVQKAWLLLQQIFDKTQDIAINEQSFDGFMEAFLEHDMPSCAKLDQEIYNYFLRFFREFKFELVKAVVTNTTFIGQSWTDPSTFSQLRINLGNLPVIAYTSNIMPFLETDEALTMLNCMDSLKPRFCIYSDLKGKEPYRKPEHTFLMEGLDKAKVAQSLELPELVEAVEKQQAATTIRTC